MDGIEFVNVHKQFAVQDRVLHVLKGVDLKIDRGSLTVILGKSGCGKTTLLRLAGGLETADGGEIRYGMERRSAYVFQEPRLMPWLTVWGNARFALRRREYDPAAIRRILHTVGLDGFEKAYPAQLSGGMQQRVALARALAYRPSFIMMDEPFAALDYFTREQMQKELLRVRRETGASILFVTHSIDEALILADKIAVIRGGRVAAEYATEAAADARRPMMSRLSRMYRSSISLLDEPAEEGEAPERESRAPAGRQAGAREEI